MGGGGAEEQVVEAVVGQSEEEGETGVFLYEASPEY